MRVAQVRVVRKGVTAAELAMVLSRRLGGGLLPRDTAVWLAM